MHGKIETAVPPHPENNLDIWGSTTGFEKGNDKSASHWKSNHSPLRNQICRTLSSNGYQKVIDR